jgi:tetratricopeptide (TPR) repeat protein
VDLDIQVNNKQEMVLIKIYKLCLLLTACCFIYGCHAGKELAESKGKKEDLDVSQKIDYEYILTEATKQKLFGNFKQAITLYEKCIQVNKNSDIAYYQIGNIFLITGNYDNALTYARKATELNDENYWYKIQLAQLYLAKNYKDSAKVVYQQILEKWPEKVEINFELARIYEEDKEYDKSIKILNKIEKENGISEPVSMLREQIYVKTGKNDLAVDELLKLIKLMPDEIRYLGLLAELYNSIGRNEEARETYERIFRIDPENITALLSYAEFMRDIGKTDEQYKIIDKIFRDEKIQVDQKLQVLIGYLTDENEFKKSNEKIGELINILLRLYPENYRVKTAHADYLVKNNKYNEALEEYNCVLSVEKNNYFIWEQILFIDNMLGNVEAVYDRSDEAIKIFRDKPVLYLFKGSAAMRLGNNEEAISVLEDGIKKAGDNQQLELQFYSIVAEAYRAIGNHEKSDDYYEKALKLDPNNLLILNNYSYFLSLRKKKLDIAEKMSKKTIIAEPENSTYLDTYAWVLFKSENLKKALEYIEKAVQFGGSGDPDILEHYGDILDKLGRKSEAVKYWKLSIEKGNDKERMSKKIEAVESNE